MSINTDNSIAKQQGTAVKKVLVIGYVWPEPNSSAAGVHMLAMLRVYKQAGWQVEFATPAQPSEHMLDLSVEGITTQAIELNCDSFDKYILEYNPSMVVFDRFMMEEQFGWRVEKNCPQALRVLDTSDLQCLRHARHQAHKAKREMSRGDLFSDMAKREIAAILRSDLSFIISDFEMRLLIDTFKVDASLLCHIPFLVDLASLKQQTRSYEQRQHFITIGSFRHEPNWDAILYLQSLWPKICQQIPQAELHIYGSYPPPKATALHKPKMGFYIKGWVDDVHKVMESARVCLAPLRFGAGIKGKLLDAMLNQTPSVTSSIGSEAMYDKATQQWPGRVEDGEQAFIDAAVELYQNQAQWQAAQAQIKPLLHDRYDAKRLENKIVKTIESLFLDVEQHRLHNFSGAMLRHHSMQSTKYMSQWIAEKNKGEVK